VSAQVRGIPGVRAPARRDTVRARPDTSRKDSTKADSARVKQLIKWNEVDSVMKILMARPGYTPTRYQGDEVVYDVRTRTLHIVGNKAGVEREQTVLVGDTIVY